MKSVIDINAGEKGFFWKIREACPMREGQSYLTKTPNSRSVIYCINILVCTAKTFLCSEKPALVLQRCHKLLLTVPYSVLCYTK